MNKKIIKNIKGVTLVALVVTIIVLLILAGVAINLAIGNNGLFTRAKNAAEKWQEASDAEQGQLDEFEKLYDNTIKDLNIGNTSGGDGTGDGDDDKTKEELEKIIEELKSKQATGNAEAEDVLEGKTFSNSNAIDVAGTMPNRGLLNWSKSNTTYSVPEGYYSGGTIDSRPSYTAGYNAGKASIRSYRVKTGTTASAIVSSKRQINIGSIGFTPRIVFAQTNGDILIYSADLNRWSTPDGQGDRKRKKWKLGNHVNISNII